MSVEREAEAEIRRLHYAEHWPVGTIANQLSIHADVVRRVLQAINPHESKQVRIKAVDAYANFIDETLKQHPTLRATRLFDMVRARGYEGSVRTLRQHVAGVRPRPKPEAFLRIETLIGDQSQIDWAHVGKAPVEGGERPLWLFVMVLSWSRGMWGEFTFDLTANSLMRSLTRAVNYFGGSTRQWLFDNPKTVVLERHGSAARFHPKLVEVSSHYFTSLHLCGVRKANQKGRVERAIRYVRERFLAARHIRNIEQGNRELLTFLSEVAHARPHPTIAGKSVSECLAEEKQRLLPMPKSPASTDTVEPVAIDKTAFARFDSNLYSVPPEFVQKTLTLAADDSVIRLLDGANEVARHSRCWGRRQRIEDIAHRQALLEQKRGALESKGQSRLRLVVPGVDRLFERWVDAGRNMGSVTSQMIDLLNAYGEAIVADAVGEVIARGMHDPGAVAVLCEQHRRKANKPVPIEIEVQSHVGDREVIPHSLEVYDVKSKRRH